MEKRTILLATFTKPNFIESVVNKLNDKFGIEKRDIFFFETEYGDILMTYRVSVKFGERLDIKKDLRKTIQIHKKGTSFFTINALNKLIERDNNLVSGNIEHSQYTVDWSDYNNTLILLQKGELDLVTILRYDY